MSKTAWQQMTDPVVWLFVLMVSTAFGAVANGVRAFVGSDPDGLVWGVAYAIVAWVFAVAFVNRCIRLGRVDGEVI